jgi:hypothetical protein
MVQSTLPPGTESWGERYGAIGVVAALALAALILALRQFLLERREDRGRLAKEQEEHDKRVEALQAKLVETVSTNHQQTLRLLAEQQQIHEQRLASERQASEQRFSSMLERHMTETRSNADQLRALNAATTDALKAVARKISRGAD